MLFGYKLLLDIVFMTEEIDLHVLTFWNHHNNF